MKIAIPVVDGKLCVHFGHCQAFVLVTVDSETRTITAQETAAAPPHEPGVLPVWLAGKGVTAVIAGGMGVRAQSLFSQQGIQVVVGAASETPEGLVTSFLDGTLEAGANLCDH